ncbi:Mitochondrial import inner membrane translocase, subunit TIM9 [Handroanthus impetiginosus]|uniref:Mitochondrial import inner membrane translocase subunit n=1 Tax=Handroanthus impetiginosus TaxID=429701 RepID=A0A2G9G5W3_9LAMI|nr:Mitochondrial import inner membrane translocase, subunit TIM9 [Handroanthus impetiginosus]
MDPNLLAADLSCLSEEDKAKISSIIDNFQIRDSLRTYSSLTERCFSDCVNNFYRKSLGKQEEDCVMRCTQKFLKLSMRVSIRFAELNPDASTQ